MRSIIVNIIITLMIIILGSFLGGNLSDGLYVFLLSTLIIYAVCIQLLFSNLITGSILNKLKCGGPFEVLRTFVC